MKDYKTEALRQHRHNSSDDFVFGYDRNEIDKFVEPLLSKNGHIKMMFVVAMTTKEANEQYPNNAEDSTCSTTCPCGERLWLSGSWNFYERTIICCPTCDRLRLSPYSRRKDIMEGSNAG